MVICIAALALGPVSALAGSPPIDLQPVSAMATKQHLRELTAVLERYYPYLKTEQERIRFDARATRVDGSIQGQIPTWREWLLQQKLIRSLNDPHAAIYMNALEDRALAVKFRWISDGLLISPAPWMHPRLFPKNSELVRIGGETPAQILPHLEALYAGTSGWVAESPGFLLRYAYELRWLGLLRGNRPVIVTLRTPQGHLRRLELAVQAVPDFTALAKMGRQKPWFTWTLDKKHNVAWFTLSSMKLTGPFEHAVSSFFAAVKEAGITRVAVDLRLNGGGASLAEAPFMQYLGVTKIQDYSSETYFDPTHLRQEIRQLDQDLKRLGLSKAEGLKTSGSTTPTPPQPPPDQVFHGQFFVVTGPGTFSSAMEFAADVKFNHLGTIVGLPCGEVVTGPGDVKWFPHPPSGVPFQVPTDVERWPGLPSNAQVQPDVTIPLTVRDVQRGVDPVRQWFDARNPSRDRV
jgi:hypothetical protein